MLHFTLEYSSSQRIKKEQVKALKRNMDIQDMLIHMETMGFLNVCSDRERQREEIWRWKDKKR